MLYVRISGRALVDHVEKGGNEQCSLQEVRLGSCQVAYLPKAMVAVEVRGVCMSTTRVAAGVMGRTEAAKVVAEGDKMQKGG